MTKEELISSYPKLLFSSTPYLIWFIVLVVLFFVSVTVIRVKTGDPVSLNLVVTVPTAIFVIVASIGLLNFFEVYSQFNDKEKLWKKESFESKFLNSLPEERMAVVDSKLNNGSYELLLDTSHPTSIIYGVKDVETFNSEQGNDKAYVTAKYVSGLDEANIKDGFYSVKLHMPKR